VASYDAEPVPDGNATARERAIVGSRGGSWLFRVAPSSTRQQTRIEYRGMQCRLDAGLEVPSEVYDQPDTRQPDR
jgi:hypothetical protein